MATRRTKKNIKRTPNIFEGGGWADMTKQQKAGSIAGAATAGLGLLTNAFDQAKIADTTGIESNIDNQRNYIVGANNNDALMSEWSNMTNLEAIKSKDLRGSNAGMGMLNGAVSGASGGASFGPWGAAIGAGVGLISSGIGSLVGANKAKKKANALNAEITTANAMRSNAFVNKANAIDSMNDQNMMANFAAYGGQLFANGGDFTNGVTFINAGGTHEENPNMGVPMGVDQEGTPNLVEEGEVKFDDYIFSNRITADDKSLGISGLPERYKGKTYADIAKKLQKESSERPNDPISKKGLEEAMSRLTQAQENQKMIQEMKKSNNKNVNMFWGGGDSNMFQTPESLVNPKNMFLQGINRYDPFGERVMETMSLGNPKRIDPIKPNLVTGLEAPKLVGSIKETIPPPRTRIGSNLKFDTSWLRYAPVLGSAISVAGDLMGNNKPDYTNADRIAKANRPVSFDPIGDYMDYNPLDRDYYQNKLNQQASATRDAVINNSGGNRGAATAGILAADFNAQSKVGDLARMAEEYNATQKLKSTEFNRGTNMYNSEMGFKTDAANRESDLMTARMVALMREDERNRSNMTRSANLTNLFDNLGNVGWEQANRNMITSNPALYYTVKGNGEIEYKFPPGTTPADEAAIRAHAEKEKKSREYAKGGKLKTKKTFTYGW